MGQKMLHGELSRGGGQTKSTGREEMNECCTGSWQGRQVTAIFAKKGPISGRLDGKHALSG